MMTERLNITRGVNKKPVATDALEQSLEILQGIQGEVFTGYPLIARQTANTRLMPPW